MEVYLTWMGIFIAGFLFRQVMRFQEALAVLGRNMAIAENSKAPAISYQNSVTPPWLVTAWIWLASGAAGLTALSAYFAGIAGSIVGIALFLLGVLISGLGSTALASPSPLTYYRLAYHTLANREANYRRNGDITHAEAAKHLQFLMRTVIGDRLRTK
jgi:hypothetical protein